MELDPLIVKLLLDSTGYNTGLKTAGANTQNTGMNMKSLLSGVGLSGVASFLGITGAIAGTVAELKACVNTTMEYLNTIHEMSLLNGTSIEETARLIAVTGRYEVSQSQLDLASRTLAKNGLSLTVDSLATLSDQFNALSTADEKEAFLMANFGARGGTAFVQLMDAGSQTIRDEATAVNEGLIPNEAMLAMQNNQKNAVYDLSLAWKAFELQIGTEIIPGLTELVKALTPVVNSLMWVINAIQWIGEHQIGNMIGSWAASNLTQATQMHTMNAVSPRLTGEMDLPGGGGFNEPFTSGSTGGGIDTNKLAMAIRDAILQVMG
jgi:hypothetical protein